MFEWITITLMSGQTNKVSHYHLTGLVVYDEQQHDNQKLLIKRKGRPPNVKDLLSSCPLSPKKVLPSIQITAAYKASVMCVLA